jgi:protein TIF31
LVARTQSCQGDFRGALQNEKETYAIYKQQLGEEHEKTKESSECLRHLTQQAVVLQKKMNEICKGNATTMIPPIQIQSPSMSSVLEMLNIINGILFVQISSQDMESLKNDLSVEKNVAVAKADESKCTELPEIHKSSDATIEKKILDEVKPVQCQASA